jgi:hypothetical protein
VSFLPHLKKPTALSRTPAQTAPIKTQPDVFVEGSLAFVSQRSMTRLGSFHIPLNKGFSAGCPQRSYEMPIDRSVAQRPGKRAANNMILRR